MIEAVLFDIDGTLIDSVNLHAQAWQEAFRRNGIERDFDSVRKQIGKGGDKLMREFLSPDQLKKFGSDIEKERQVIFKKDYLPLVMPFPKVKELFARLKKDGVRSRSLPLRRVKNCRHTRKYWE